MKFMLDHFSRLFPKWKPRQQATLAMARIISQHDVAVLPYESGLKQERRSHDERHASVGVWLIACPQDADSETLDFGTASPAITHDLRNDGVGVMTSTSLNDSHFVLALPEDDSCWRFFLTRVCHNTRKNGGWYQLGLHLEGILEPTSEQLRIFRKRLEQETAVHDSETADPSETLRLCGLTDSDAAQPARK